MRISLGPGIGLNLIVGLGLAGFFLDWVMFIFVKDGFIIALSVLVLLFLYFS